MAALLEVRSVSKSFPGVRALDTVSLSVAQGELLAVVGENGAGKSTLMKILAGIEEPDSGEIRLDGQPVAVTSTRRAQDLGIALIHQELNLAGNLSIGANIFLGREPRAGCFLRERELEKRSAALMRQIGLTVPATTLVDQLSPGRQQLVEIAKALSAEARLLIMDEPTSNLSQSETQTLFDVVRDLRARGVSIVYISHRLSEVKAVADRVVVLRDGRNAGELARDEIEHDRIVRLMVGRDFKFPQARRNDRTLARSAVLEVKALRTAAFPAHAASFELFAGEIVGLAGLVGAGRTELLEALFGLNPPRGGDVIIRDPSAESWASRQVGCMRSPHEAIRAGMALVPEDRKQQGVILEMAVRENLSLAALRRQAHAGFIDFTREKRTAAELIERLNVRTPSDRQRVGNLSGGNQQKVVLGKWLALCPRILLLDEPTRGIDVAAKQEIYSLIEALAAEGVAVLFVSSEMEEILRLSQRVMVMSEGRIAGELRAGEISEEAVMRLATETMKA